ncbi:LysM peptidoglycan-binding domain-containing protein [Hippea sp. KM1]|uniref:LysM peptidoglycan-binding domain-containing protein n=1 Tax=Hippea sp. KM1 TaxID=944481 RepID=UPI00046D3AAA|nr:LysM peptidoglycan-binding domain-containing protein [Hippea sp. KM1]
MRRWLLALFFIFVSLNVAYGYGELYIVKPHDTLWSISKRFYKNPFLWGKLWYNNTYINDPNLIFPGEILKITEHGLEIATLSKKKPDHKQPEKVRYLSAIWYDGAKFYSTCQQGECVWHKDEFRIATISFDTYTNIEPRQGDVVYLHTSKPKLPKKLYIYRNLKNYLDLKLCDHDFEAYMPIGEIDVESKIKDGVYKGRIAKCSTEVAEDDVISTVYPYQQISSKPQEVKLGGIGIRQLFVAQNELQSGLGFFFFFKADKPIQKDIVGKAVVIERLNKGSAEPIPIGRGIVSSQYKYYLSIFFPSSEGLEEIPDRTQKYILR